MNRRRTQAACQINKRIHLTRKQFAVFKRTFRAFVKNALTDQNYPLFLRDLYAETYRRPGLFRVQIQFDQVRPRRQQTRSDYKKHTPPVLPDGRIARTPVPRPSQGDPTTFYSLPPLIRYLLDRRPDSVTVRGYRRLDGMIRAAKELTRRQRTVSYQRF